MNILNVNVKSARFTEIISSVHKKRISS